METDKKHLNFDFTFLDAQSPVVPIGAREIGSATRGFSPRVNWRKIWTFGVIGFFIVLGIWSNQHPEHNGTSQSYQPSSANANADASFTPSAANSSSSVSNGHFMCSQYDSSQADALNPTDRSDLDAETDALNQRKRELDNLKMQIEGSSNPQGADQASINQYNGLVDAYNAQLETLKADWAAHQRRVDTYNQAVQNRNTYLVTHCRASN